MNSSTQNQEGPGIDFLEIAFVLFRHKWKVILFSLLGFVAAGATYFVASRYYQSDATLLIRYVVERSSVDSVNSHADTAGRGGEGLIAAEAEILGSWDLAVQTAQAVGPERILSGIPGDVSLTKAAGVIREGLEVTVKKGSHVIRVSFRSKNPEIVQPVLDEFIRQYFDKHLQVHRSLQAFDFVSKQRDDVRFRLNDIQDQLKKLKDQAGITSLVDSTAALNSQIAKVQEGLMVANAARAEQSARLAHFAKHLGLEDKSKASEAESAESPGVPPQELQEYRLLTEQLDAFRKTEIQLLAQYTAENSVVRVKQEQIRGLEQRKAELEAKYPSLTSVSVKNTGGGQPIDIPGEQANLLATEAKIETLKTQLEQLQAVAAKINAVSAQIEDLERQKAIEEKTYADFQLKLEMQRINEALDPSKIPNISTVQKPSPPAIVVGKTKKIVMGLAGGGIAAGLGVALLCGIVLDRTVKRPAELEKRLGIPMMLQIPMLTAREIRRLRNTPPELPRSGELISAAKNGSTAPAAAPWNDDHFIRPFAQIIRDRLILNFELKRITHKPKLIAVTGLSGGEGASTLAGGLAAAISEADHGKVLLVDMNSDNAEMRPFFEGRSGAALMDAIYANGNGIAAAENLYLATGEAPGSNSRMIAPRRFYEMVPTLRESHFDYIIFDMPPMEQGSATLAVSGFMDKVLLVTEPERNERAALKRSYSELVAAKADVAAIVNKTRNGVPRWVRG